MAPNVPTLTAIQRITDAPPIMAAPNPSEKTAKANKMHSCEKDAKQHPRQCTPHHEYCAEKCRSPSNTYPHNLNTLVTANTYSEHTTCAHTYPLWQIQTHSRWTPQLPYHKPRGNQLPHRVCVGTILQYPHSQKITPGHFPELSQFQTTCHANGASNY